MLKLFIKLFASNTNPKSLSTKLRRKRFKLFVYQIDNLSKKLNRPLRILDVGGTENFWEMMNFSSTEHHITILNLNNQFTKYKNFISVVGDARFMNKFAKDQFDFIFSNSVIEHLGSYDNQILMANEIQRISKNYYLQTPSYYFPIEPHFLFPFFHWLPRKIRIFLVMNFSLGWFDRKKNRNEAEKLVDEIRLLKLFELKNLFPDAKIIKERFLGLTKSYIVLKT